MKRKGFRPKKRLGQNFLYDPAIAGKIVAAAALAPGQVVVELGPGKGILTRPLAASGVHLVAIEIDGALAEALDGELGRKAPAGEAGVEIVRADLAKTSLTELLATRGFERCVLFGNIPYNMTREVLFSFLVDEHRMIEAAYLMVQREVGARLVEGPGSRTYGVTSVILQSLYSVKKLFNVAPGSFNPRPKVASVVLEFIPLETPLVPEDEFKRFAQLVRNLFQQRRKTIHNTIRSFYGITRGEIDDIHAATGIDLDKRPEQMTGEEFRELARSLAEVTSVG